jgi:hypothetical protein
MSSRRVYQLKSAADIFRHSLGLITQAGVVLLKLFESILQLVQLSLGIAS